jgi:hypothetical protein
LVSILPISYYGLSKDKSVWETSCMNLLMKIFLTKIQGSYLRSCVTPSNYGLYPGIHRWQIVSRRAVGPRWHDAVAYTIVQTMTMSYFRQTIAAGLPAFAYLKRANNGSDWLPPGEVSGQKTSGIRYAITASGWKWCALGMQPNATSEWENFSCGCTESTVLRPQHCSVGRV